MISTGSIGNGTTNAKKDIVTKDIKTRKARGKPVKPQAVLKEVKTALKNKDPMIVAIAKPVKKKGK